MPSMKQTIVRVTKVEKQKASTGANGYKVYFNKKGWDYKRWISEKEAESLEIDENTTGKYLICADLGMFSGYREFQLLPLTEEENAV